MELETINPYVMKILIACRPEDSINAISKRIGLSYGWTHKWANELIDAGVFKVKGQSIVLQQDNAFYKATIQYIRERFTADVGFHYSVLGLFGVTYSFTKTDAVFVWTNGGYNIGRSRDYYPIFIKIKKDDFSRFEFYCRKLGLKTGANEGIFYEYEIKDEIKMTLHKNIPVDSLAETISFMEKHIYNFQPALEMIGELYKIKVKAAYKERF